MPSPSLLQPLGCETFPQSAASDIPAAIARYAARGGTPRPAPLPAHLRRLEAESIGIFRDITAQCANPVLLYSIGKDSSVLLHLARKAFWPGALPFPVLHIATGWDFRAMLEFRDLIAPALGLRLTIHTSAEGAARGVAPFGPLAGQHAGVMITQALLQALGQGRHDAAFGGGRRDEELSRAKERIVSLRSPGHGWDPRRQRPEFRALYNARLSSGESLRVFPLSNWTETDVWTYIAAEDIPIVPLYFAAPRPVVGRGGALIMVDDERLPLLPGERPRLLPIRFRTLGCYPLTGALESEATDVPAILAEIAASRLSERQGRLVDHDPAASMERKKREGYF